MEGVEAEEESCFRIGETYTSPEGEEGEGAAAGTREREEKEREEMNQ